MAGHRREEAEELSVEMGRTWGSENWDLQLTALFFPQRD